VATIHLVSPRSELGPWDWTAPDTGIGGSETMHCEVAWRLAARGHQVYSYCPLAVKQCYQKIRGVVWRPIDDLVTDCEHPGLWMFIRDVQTPATFEVRDDQRVWIVMQDADLPRWPTVMPAVSRILALCTAHLEYLQRTHPRFASQLFLSRNGLRGDLVGTVLAEPPQPRNPHRLMFASSPDRGLYEVLQAFSLIRFCVPDAELHVFYGWDNIHKLKATGSLQWTEQRIRRLAAQPGVVLHGRTGQPDLYREWLKSALYVAPTNFLETGHISLLEAQALGAIPIVNPLWATGQYQRGGIAIAGDPEHEQVTLRRYAMAAVHLMQHPEVQEEMRQPMMETARKEFDWEDVIDQYEQWIAEEGL
jgi:hypothetical protein